MDLITSCVLLLVCIAGIIFLNRAKGTKITKKVRLTGTVVLSALALAAIVYAALTVLLVGGIG